MSIAQAVIQEIKDRYGWSDDDVYQLQHPNIDDLHSPYLLENVNDFNEVLSKYIGQQILIMPDYDADGILSGSLLSAALDVFGFERVDTYAPRINTGYGVTQESADDAIRQFGLPDLVLTTDNGSNAYDGVMYFQEQGVKVLVTDHHRVGDLDPGDVNVNPQRPTDDYPFKGISGTMVIWKVMQAYAQTYGTERQQRLIDQLIVLVGISTISDVMPIIDENRYVVDESVRLLQNKDFLTHGSDLTGRYGSVFKGLLALHTVCDEQGKFNYGFDETTFGFLYGPMLNSPRRMSGSSQLGFNLFLSEDDDLAYQYAKELFGTNTERKQIMQKYGREYLKDTYDTDEKELYSVGVVPYGHGLIGLLSGQFTNKYGLPSIVFRASDVPGVVFDGDLPETVEYLSGSGRSPVWFNLHDVLSEMRNQQPEMFRSFGGHSQAAGLSINAKYYEIFRQQFIQAIRERLAELDSGVSMVDETVVWLPWEQYAPDDLLAFEQVIAFVESVKPFGQEFREPEFGLTFSTNDASVRFMGADQQHVKFELANGMDIIQWNGAEALRRQLGHLSAPFNFSVVGRLGINEFRGVKTIQIIVEDLVVL